MTREEFLKKLQLCYFGEKKAFNEIVEYFDTLQNSLQTQCQSLQSQVNYLRRSIERKEEQIADWQSDYVLAQSKIDKAIEFINNKSLGNLKITFGKELLQILERTDK